jgi:hypothetical protein
MVAQEDVLHMVSKVSLFEGATIPSLEELV